MLPIVLLLLGVLKNFRTPKAAPGRFVHLRRLLPADHLIKGLVIVPLFLLLISFS